MLSSSIFVGNTVRRLTKGSEQCLYLNQTFLQDIFCFCRDDLEKLDFEIECFLLENWVKQVDAETGMHLQSSKLSVMTKNAHNNINSVRNIN